MDKKVFKCGVSTCNRNKYIKNNRKLWKQKYKGWSRENAIVITVKKDTIRVDVSNIK